MRRRLIAWSAACAIGFGAAFAVASIAATAPDPIAADDHAAIAADPVAISPLPGQPAPAHTESPPAARRKAHRAESLVPVADLEMPPFLAQAQRGGLDRRDPWTAEDLPPSRTVAKLDRADPWTGGAL